MHSRESRVYRLLSPESSATRRFTTPTRNEQLTRTTQCGPPPPRDTIFCSRGGLRVGHRCHFAGKVCGISLNTFASLDTAKVKQLNMRTSICKHFLHAVLNEKKCYSTATNQRKHLVS